MLCPQCGLESEANFCPNCGTDLRAVAGDIPPLKEPYPQIVNGKSIDLNRVIRMYGTGIRRIGAYAYLQTETGISNAGAKAILDPVYAAHSGEKTSLLDGAMAQSQHSGQSREDWRREENEWNAEGKTFCPKCHSLDVTAQKKGFGVIRGTAGTVLTGKLGVGAVAGAIGSNKIILTCMKCGHQWKPGHK